MLVVGETTIDRPRFPIIDAHNHLGTPFGGGWDKRPVAELGPVARALDSSIPGRWSVPGNAQQPPQRGVTRPPISGKRS